MHIQVDRQERACRKVLQRALTRAALDQDIHAIDEAEGMIAHKEHKLERLLTQSNIFQVVLHSPKLVFYMWRVMHAQANPSEMVFLLSVVYQFCPIAS